MKLVTFTHDGSERLGVLVDQGVVDLSAVAHASGMGGEEIAADALSFLAADRRGRDLGAALVAWALARSDPALLVPEPAIRLLAPVPRPPKILCLAGNYAEHWREGGLAAPPKTNHVPEVFIKPVTTIVGPGAPIRRPGPLCPAVDYEGELAVVIGRSVHAVSAERALDYVAGYTCFDDVSGRALAIDIPRPPSARAEFFDWLNGKWFDTFGPLGPYLALDEIADPQRLTVQTRVNGEVRQNASTADMIFTVAEAIAWISRFLTLQPGDVLATGTPSGVGATTQTYLQAGDVVEVEISGLGILRNPVE